MYLNTDQAKIMRYNAVLLLTEVLPYKTGEADYRLVCKDYGGLGTTCGFLLHWLLWRLGLTNQNLSTIPPPASNPKGPPRVRCTINRSESGFQYVAGDNLSCIRYSSEFSVATPGNALQQGRRPGPGDPVYIYQTNPQGPQNTEHAFCFVSEENGLWYTAESGQEYGQWGKFRNDRRLRVQNHGTKISGNSPERTIIGWLPLDQLDFGPPPVKSWPEGGRDFV
jgi:hypothetical protein